MAWALTNRPRFHSCRLWQGLWHGRSSSGRGRGVRRLAWSLLRLPGDCDGSQRCPDRHARPDIDQNTIEDPVFKDLDLDRSFLCLDHGDDVAVVETQKGAIE